MALKITKVAALPKSLGKGGGKVNEVLNAFAADVMAEDWSEAFDGGVDDEGNALTVPVRIEGYDDSLTAGQIAAKVNALIADANLDTPFYLVAKNVDENGEPCTVERTVKERGTGADKSITVANALFAVAGVKPVQTRERKATESADVEPDTELDEDGNPIAD